VTGEAEKGHEYLEKEQGTVCGVLESVRCVCGERTRLSLSGCRDVWGREGRKGKDDSLARYPACRLFLFFPFSSFVHFFFSVLSVLPLPSSC